VKTRVLLVVVLAIALAIAGCSGGDAEKGENRAAVETAEQPTGSTGPVGDVLAVFPADSLDGVIDREMLSLDAEGSDGSPSLLAEATEPTTYRLFETGDLDVENSLLIYTAMVRTDELKGTAMLEMWCEFGDMGEFYSRGMDSTLTGTEDWTELRTVFRLEAGQNPENVKLNLIVGGAGRVWIDDIKVTRTPLP